MRTFGIAYLGFFVIGVGSAPAQAPAESANAPWMQQFAGTALEAVAAPQPRSNGLFSRWSRRSNGVDGLNVPTDSSFSPPLFPPGRGSPRKEASLPSAASANQP